MTIPVHVALVDVDGVAAGVLPEVAAALNEQIQSDVAPHWHGHFTHATVGAYLNAADVPSDTWRILLKRDIQEPGALGYHTDDHFQPYALVDVDAGDWTVTASHELLEMLADPWGNHMKKARHPQGVHPEDIGLHGNRRRVTYLVEVCDPSEALVYEIGGVEVSDFLTPDWYRTTPKAGVGASHLGIAPRTVLKGGYVSFHVDGYWYQAFTDRHGTTTVEALGRFDRRKFGSIREWTDLNARMIRS